MTTKKTEKLAATYVGGVDGVVVHLPSGRVLTFKSGETHDILASEHDALANHPEFTVASATKESN